MLITMLKQVPGTMPNGRPWPPEGETVEVPDQKGRDVIGFGWAEPAAETAKPAKRSAQRKPRKPAPRRAQSAPPDGGTIPAPGDPAAPDDTTPNTEDQP